MVEIKTVDDCINLITNDTTIMVGGFLGIGAPLKIIDALAESDIENLTLVSVVAGYPGGGFDIGKLTKNRKIKKFIGSHIGTDPELIQQFNAGEIKVEFNPMGTWIERIRAAGAGLGAVVTQTGLGTEVEEGCEKIIIEGKPFLLYTPLKADVAIIKGHKADKAGNIQYRGTALNSNPVMATAANLVIAEVDEIVEQGELEPNRIGTPGIFVDILVQGDSQKERKDQFDDIWLKTGRLS